MSAHVLSEVLRRYPRGGAEKLMALAIADQAADDGRVFIGDDLCHLARAAHVPIHEVAGMIAGMVRSGWLDAPIDDCPGRTSVCSAVHRISPQWLVDRAAVNSAGERP